MDYEDDFESPLTETAYVLLDLAPVETYNVFLMHTLRSGKVFEKSSQTQVMASSQSIQTHSIPFSTKAIQVPDNDTSGNSLSQFLRRSTLILSALLSENEKEDDIPEIHPTVPFTLGYTQMTMSEWSIGNEWNTHLKEHQLSRIFVISELLISFLESKLPHAHHLIVLQHTHPLSKPFAFLSVPSLPTACASMDASLFVIGTEDGGIYLFDTKNVHFSTPWKDSMLYHSCFTSDTLAIAHVGHYSSIISLFAYQERSEKRLMVLDESGKVSQWYLESMQKKTVPSDAHTRPCSHYRLLSRGLHSVFKSDTLLTACTHVLRHSYLATMEGSLSCLDGIQLNRLSIEKHYEPIYSLINSPFYPHLLAYCTSGTVRIFHSQHRRFIWDYTFQTNDVLGCLFSSKRPGIFIVFHQFTLSVWDWTLDLVEPTHSIHFESEMLDVVEHDGCLGIAYRNGELEWLELDDTLTQCTLDEEKDVLTHFQ